MGGLLQQLISLDLWYLIHQAAVLLWLLLLPALLQVALYQTLLLPACWVSVSKPQASLHNTIWFCCRSTTCMTHCSVTADPYTAGIVRIYNYKHYGFLMQHTTAYSAPSGGSTPV